MRTIYKVNYWFVDDSYWDDGNRTTKRDRSFNTLEDAVIFAKDIISNGVNEKSRVTNKTQIFQIQKDDINIEEISTKIHPWWSILKDDQYIIEKIKSYFKHNNFKSLVEFEKEVLEHYNRDCWDKMIDLAKNEILIKPRKH